LVINIGNKVLLQFGHKDDVGYNYYTITFPTAFTSTSYYFVTSGDVRDTTRTVTTFKGQYAWGNGAASYGRIYWICIGY